MRVRVEAPGAEPAAATLEVDEARVVGPVRITVLDAGLGRQKPSDKREQGFAQLRLEPAG